MKKIVFLITLLVLAACSATPTPVVVPTLAVLPTLAPSSTLTDTPIPTWTPSEAPTVEVTATPSDTPEPTITLTASALPSATVEPTLEPTITFTPSLTITNTITYTPSPTYTASPELDDLGMLALLSERATILPPELLYNPQTLTAVSYAAQTLIAGRFAASPTPVFGTPAFGTVAFGTPQLATLPPANAVCTVPPPGGLGAAFAGDPSLAGLIGCAVGSISSTTTAIQSFEHGAMIYVQGNPAYIYVLTQDGRFRRFNDTWVSGVDPETGGETPPTGLLEPKRGFGKVWRSNLDVRAALGWGVTEEQGDTSSVQGFERGRALYLPQRGETTLLIDDPGGATGSWRTLAASF